MEEQEKPQTEKPINWLKIQREWKRGVLNLKDLSVKYNIKYSTIYSKSRKWSMVKNAVMEKAIQSASEVIATDLKAWLGKELQDVMKMTEVVNRLWMNPETATQEDLDKLETLSKMRSRLHDMGKSAQGIGNKVDITSGGESLQANILASLTTIREMHQQGKLDHVVIDVEETKRAVAEGLEEG